MEHGTLDGYTNHRCRCQPCKDAANAYQRDRVQKRRAAYFADKSCVRCGTRENLVNHHRDPKTKGANFNTVWSWSEPRQIVELAKCEVLCKSCHSKLHNRQRLKPIVHGTIHAYSHRKCRCDSCCAAWNAYQRAYGKRKRAEARAAGVTGLARKAKPIQHGTYFAYVRHKCRCEACRAASAAYQRAHAQKKRSR